jgi:PAS domain-containing protein
VIAYALAIELSLLLALSLALGVWQMHPSTSGRITLVLALAAIMLWGGGDLLAARALTSELFADRVEYLGVLALPPLWLGFAAHAAGLPIARRVPWFTSLLLLPGACAYALLFSSRYASLFALTVEGGQDIHGPLWIALALYAQCLVGAGSAILLASSLRAGDGRVAARIAAGLAPLAPLLGNSLYLASDPPWPVDPTPVLLGVAVLVVRGAVFSGGLLQTLPVSQRDLLQQLPLGVLLTNRHDVVVEINDAAGTHIGVSEAQAVGRPLEEVLARQPQRLRVRTARLSHWGRSAGHLVLVEPRSA